jgi:hypothetical protein
MKNYQFKHPETQEWVTIVAESFHEALAKLKQLVGLR